MLTRLVYQSAKDRAAHHLDRAGIFLKPEEQEEIEVADFGLSDLARYGLQLFTYVNTERCCAKEIVLFPRQTCPEHRHPPIPSLAYAGKEETFRCQAGSIYLYLPGTVTSEIGALIPRGEEQNFTVYQEVYLEQGDQITIPPDTLHWFQGGDEGAVATEFSTTSYDEHDVFTDARVQRTTQIVD
ncbi:MAG: D-lyxose/D-mannose family sugar isomerase [Cytophagales bacterium]|nr:D-lyxose/D-mannose family sugar isomerase [Armatimonadota bacterium]